MPARTTTPFSHLQILECGQEIVLDDPDSMRIADFIFGLLFFEKSFQIVNSLLGDRDETVFCNQAGASALGLRGLGCNIAIALLFSVIEPGLL
ncbi:hypothetical protein WL29_06815 [Burkholderia ubonensis]|uniref:Uncharacterized protein n=1 Tax=Burkholderia ubonensis TaxID=101571 RepID=A0A102Z617_9BURK|nr:hypothetical protein WI77_26765 [Burkholderia ubonensis]KWA70848.1 hypothetical protein WL29_06815 [Burkholderia ubonensis]OJB20057.1 hypothetical protein BGV54_18635 [Burkholderia ubonensis]